MRDNEEELEENDVNSELRYITLALMKIAARRKKPFRKIAKEYIKNVYILRQLIDKERKYYEE